MHQQLGQTKMDMSGDVSEAVRLNTKLKTLSMSEPSDRDVHTFSCPGIIMSAI